MIVYFLGMTTSFPHHKRDAVADHIIVGSQFNLMKRFRFTLASDLKSFDCIWYIYFHFFDMGG